MSLPRSTSTCWCEPQARGEDLLALEDSTVMGMLVMLVTRAAMAAVAAVTLAAPSLLLCTEVLQQFHKRSITQSFQETVACFRDHSRWRLGGLGGGVSGIGLPGGEEGGRDRRGTGTGLHVHLASANSSCPSTSLAFAGGVNAESPGSVVHDDASAQDLNVLQVLHEHSTIRSVAVVGTRGVVPSVEAIFEEHGIALHQLASHLERKAALRHSRLGEGVEPLQKALILGHRKVRLIPQHVTSPVLNSPTSIAVSCGITLLQGQFYLPLVVVVFRLFSSHICGTVLVGHDRKESWSDRANLPGCLFVIRGWLFALSQHDLTFRS
mmetsp:Transcript_19601/g.42390  ORF Transcript_19601/g.42390 Transcript_19601/m.42390 type:complete len:323 (-) Transcript_19601:2748-3716(-)